MRYVLDTNILVAALNGDPAVITRLNEVEPFEVAFAPVDRLIAERFGDLKADLRRRGVTKSDADLLIAATALQLGAILVTNDQDLLDGSIRELVVENWIDSAAL